MERQSLLSWFLWLIAYFLMVALAWGIWFLLFGTALLASLGASYGF